MDIKISNRIYKRGEAEEILESILSMVEKKFRPGWSATITISMDCTGHYNAKAQEDHA